MRSLLPLWLAGLLGAAAVAAVNLPVTGRRLTPSEKEARAAGRWTTLHKRTAATIFGQSSLNDTSDIQYATNITLGGTNWQVLIDTGSSDLWVAGTVPNSQSTGFTSGVTYAIGQVSGPVLTADLDFAGYTVQSQAFLQIQPDSTNPEGYGLIGLGPNHGSNIYATMGNVEAGDAPLDRIFRQNTSAPNYITALLNRADDPTEQITGYVTVGEVVSGYESVTSQPKLAVETVSIYDQGDQHWQTLIDANGIIVDGSPIQNLVTTVNTTKNQAQLTAVFDTGFSIPQVTSDVANGIYGNIEGASLQNIDGLGEIWVLPCTTEINLTFTFAGVSYPVHPLDTNLNANITSATGEIICVGGFQPISTDSGGDYDLILGMGFIRNAYLLVNFGDFVDGSTSSVAAPYIQLYSITDPGTAHQDFIKVRGTAANPVTIPNPTPTASSGGGGGTSNTHTLHGKKAIIVGVCVTVGALLLSAIITWCQRSYQRRAGRLPGPIYNSGNNAFNSVSAAASADESKWMPAQTNAYMAVGAPAPSGMPTPDSPGTTGQAYMAAPYQPYAPNGGQYAPPQGPPPPQGGQYFSSTSPPPGAGWARR